MNKFNDVDLTRGYQKYDAMVKNIEGIFNKINQLFDISEYKKELNKIINDASNDSSFSNKMLYEGMQLDYESFIYDNYIKRLDDLQKKIENELMPLYEIHLLISKINIEVKNISSDNIGDVIDQTLRLVSSINNLRNNLNEQEKELVKNAYHVIYNVILHEEIFERNDIFNYIMKLNNSSIKENIARLLARDLNKLSQEDLIDEDLKGITTEGLGYDYLTLDVIKKISLKTIGETNSEYQERKRVAILEVNKKNNRLITKRNALEEKLKNNKGLIKNLKINKALLISKACSIVLVPVITISAGGLIGKIKSDKITEYKTITRTVDLNTGNVIGDISYEYDDKVTTYAATVLVCDPWRKNPVGEGYVRNVKAYDYVSSSDTPFIATTGDSQEGIHDTNRKVDSNIKFKYQYTEATDTLKIGENTTDKSTLVIETYQDKSDSRISTKYIIPFTIGGAVLGALLDVLAILLRVYDLNDIKRIMNRLNNQIESKNMNNECILEELNKLKDEALLIEDEYSSTARKYGMSVEKLGYYIVVVEDYEQLVRDRSNYSLFYNYNDKVNLIKKYDIPEDRNNTTNKVLVKKK